MIVPQTDPLIVVVGVCASGKSRVVSELSARGYRARSVAQEHSGVPYLWRISQPDFLVVLDAQLATIKVRRSISWGEERLRFQRRRLAHARCHCDLYIATDGMTVEDIVTKICLLVENNL